MINFDLLLQTLGGMGTYQVLAFACMSFVGIPLGLISLAPIFIEYTPSYRCDLNGDYDPTYVSTQNTTTPPINQPELTDACVRYKNNSTKCPDGDIMCLNNSTIAVACESFQYNDSLFTETVVTEFDLVCDRGFLDSLASSVFMLGFLVGGFLFGIISDRFGRKWTMVGCGYGMLLMMLAVAYSSSIEVYIINRFFLAFFGMGCNIAVFSHLVELVGNNWRKFVGIGYLTIYAMGYMTWSAIAYFYRDWRQMMLCALIASSPFAVFSLLVPESPRWLFTNGQDKKGKKVVSIMSKLNKVEILKSVWVKAENSSGEKNSEARRYSTLDLFRFRGLRILTLKVGFSWSVTSMVYYGISLNTGSLKGNIFLNNIYAGILEISSYVICILAMDRVGRRLLLTISMIGAGVALLVTTVAREYAGTNQGLSTFALASAFIAKAFASAAYAVLYNFTSELFPTVIRGNGVGVGSTCAGIGTIMAPFFIGLQEYISWLPNTIFGLFAVVEGLLALTFRETAGRDMMETIEEAELFYAGKDKNRSSIFMNQ